jgi:hypothetical protein
MKESTSGDLGKTGAALTNALRPSGEHERTAFIKISPTGRPEIAFTGVWSGRLIKVAQIALPKSYRLRKLAEADRIRKREAEIKAAEAKKKSEKKKETSDVKKA